MCLEPYGRSILQGCYMNVFLVIHMASEYASDNVSADLVISSQKYPPRKDLVRAISLLTGYLVKAIGPNSCSFTYLSQADPKGETHCPQTIFRSYASVVFSLLKDI